MPISKLRDASEWITKATKTNLKAQSDDSLVLAPTNWAPNQYASELDPDGEPTPYVLREGAQPSGYHVFLTQTNGGRSTATQQTLTSRPTTNPAWLANQPLINGSPLPSNPDEFAPLPAPPAPTLEVTASTDAGYAAGTWGVAFAMVDSGGRHTTLSAVATVVLSAGQCIRQSIPSDVPDGTDSIAIYLIPPASGGGAGLVGTARHQYTVKAGREKSYEMTGPFRWNGRKAPTKNETFLGRPPQMQYAKTSRDGDIVKKRAPYDLRAGTYRFLCAYKTQMGTTPAGTVSNERTINQVQENTAWYLGAPSKPKGATGVQYFVLKNNVWYQVILARSPFGSEYAFSFDAEPRVYGYSEEKQTKLRLEQILVAGEPPTEDTSGIESFDEAPETPVAYGGSRPPAGTYGVFVCYSSGDKLSKPSKMVSATVSSTELIRVVFSSPINIFANAEGSETKQDGYPFAWTRTATDASAGYPTHSEGIFYLAANAANANLTPDWTSAAVDIDPLTIYTISGALEVTTWVSGTATVELEERNVSNAVVATTTIDSLSAAGFARLKKSFGPAASGADVTWNAATANVRLRFKLSGNPRNLTARAYNLAGHPFLGTQRKYELSKKGSYAADNPDASPHLPYSSYSFHATSPAPGVPSLTGLTGSTASVTPKDIIDFEAMTTAIAPVQAGWTHTLTGSATSTVETTAAIEGTKGWRVKDTTSSGITAGFLAKTYGTTEVTGTSLAIRHFNKVVTLPTGTGSRWVWLSAVRTSADVDMARCYVYGTGQIGLTTFSSSNAQTVADSTVYAVAGDILDIEIIVTGAGSANGKAELKVGKNGAARVTISTVSGINWSTSSPRRARVGVWEGYASSTWEVNVDRVVVTDTGDNVTVAPTVTGALRPYELPDYPSRAGTTLETQDFESGALSAGWTSNQIPLAGTTLAVQAGAAIDGGFGLRVQSSSAASAPDLYVQKTIATLRTSLGSQAKFQIDALPSTGNVKLMRITNAASALTLGEIYLDSTGALFVQPYDALGAAVGSATRIAQSLVATNVITLEMVVQNANTGAGTLSVWYALGAGAKQLMFQSTALNWNALYAERIRIGGFSASATNTFNLRVDTQIITDAGLTIYRAFDSLGGEINQHYLWLRPDEPVDQKTGIFSSEAERIPIEPGTWTYAVMGRHSYIPTANLPARPHYLTLHGPSETETELDPVELGTPYGSGVTGTAAWQDWVLANFTVPSGYTHLEISSKDISGGEFVWQEILLAKGNLNTQALRDAARGYTRATTGDATVTLDTATPNDLTGVLSALHAGTRNMNAFASEVPAGTTLTLEFRSSDNPSLDASTFSTYTTTPSAVPKRRIVQIRGTFAGDGLATPVWGINNLWASYNFARGTLLRADRTELDGGTLAGNLGLIYRLADYVTSRPGGHVFRKPTTEAIGRMGAPQVGFYTEEGLREFLENQLIDDWVIESPHLGASATQEGSVVWIRIGSPVSEPEFIELPELKIGSLRRLAAVVEIADLEVIEVGPMS